MAKRSLRPRPASQYVNQLEWDVDEDEFILARRYDALEKFREYGSRGDQGLVKEMKGEDFTLEFIQENGLTSPVVFRDVSGLGMKLPSSDFSVSDVKCLVGPKRQVDVMDTHTQKAVTMTMNQWAKYYQTQPRKKVLNIISLEFSCTKMADLVEPPSVVRQLDWVEGVWPREMKEAQTDPTNDMRKMMYPKVQKYCLMSVASCYTDFHLDFGGTSVWYHLIRGEKLFLLIPPSPEAYEMFSVWQLSGEQEGTFFADLVEHVQLIRLKAGDTFIMPSGWIHAVYTPSDSLVFGGNFLHSFNIPQQLAVAEIEARTRVPLKFRYPFYGSIHWYTLLKYSKELRRRGLCPDQESSERTEASVTSSKKGPRWLKEVSVKKVPVSSQDGLSSGSPAHRSEDSDEFTPPHPHDTHTPAHSSLKRSHSRRSDKASQLAHISSVEVEGLLVLLKKIQEEQLFLSDAPPSLADPLGLTSQLLCQLECSGIRTLTSTKPTGVSLLQQRGSLRKAKSRKRVGQSLKEFTPKKQSLEADGESFFVSESTEAEVEKSQSACHSAERSPQTEHREDSLSLKVSIRTEGCVVSGDRVPAIALESPSYNSVDFETDGLCAESAEDLPLPTSPDIDTSFTLQLPCSPASPLTPSQLLSSTHPSLKPSRNVSSPPTSSVSTPSQLSPTPTPSASTPSQLSPTPTPSASTPSQLSPTPISLLVTPTQPTSMDYITPHILTN